MDADLTWKVTWGGREWRTWGEVDAQLLFEMLKKSWPDSTPEIWELVPAGGWDPVGQVNVDGWAWRRVVWQSGRFQPADHSE
jgi:hypothetical protein